MNQCQIMNQCKITDKSHTLGLTLLASALQSPMSTAMLCAFADPHHSLGQPSQLGTMVWEKPKYFSANWEHVTSQLPTLKDELPKVSLPSACCALSVQSPKEIRLEETRRSRGVPTPHNCRSSFMCVFLLWHCQMCPSWSTSTSQLVKPSVAQYLAVMHCDFWCWTD